MTAIRKAVALALASLTLGLLSLASSGLSACESSQEPGRAGVDSIRSIDEAFRDRHEKIEQERIEALADLARSQSGEEAEQTFRYLLSTAIVGGRSLAAEKAAEEYLARKDADPETLALAALVDSMASIERNEDGEAVAVLEKFLGRSGEGEIDPAVLYSLGETFIQRLQADDKADASRRVASIFSEGPFEDEVKNHFSRRLERLERVGRPSPTIDAKDVDGEPIRLADLKGKVVLVTFWATWCPPCLSQIPELNRLYRRYRGDGLEIIGVSVDALREGGEGKQAESAVREVLVDMLVPWPTVVDSGAEGGIAASFGVTEIPASFLIDAEGQIVRVDTSGEQLDRAIADLLGVEPNPEAVEDPGVKSVTPDTPPTEPVKGPGRTPAPKAPPR